MSEQRAIEVNWVQAFAGALAAMSSAVLLSTVGVAGTLLGAAAGSVIATVGGAVYSHYLDVSRERVAGARALAVKRAARAGQRDRRPSGPTEDAAAAAGPAEPDPPGGESAPGGSTGSSGSAWGERWREAARGLPWARIAVVSVGVFVLAMGAIVAFEVAAGRSVSSFTGGSTADGPRTSLDVGGGGAGGGSDQPADTPSEPTSDEDGEVDDPDTTTETPSVAAPDEPTTEPATTEPATTEPPETDTSPESPPPSEVEPAPTPTP